MSLSQQAQPSQDLSLAPKRCAKYILGLAFACMVWQINTSLAAPAPWYLWHSKLESSYVCAQTSPGEGWRKAAGPFMDAHCKQLVNNPRH